MGERQLVRGFGQIFSQYTSKWLVYNTRGHHVNPVNANHVFFVLKKTLIMLEYHFPAIH